MTYYSSGAASTSTVWYSWNNNTTTDATAITSGSAWVNWCSGTVTISSGPSSVSLTDTGSVWVTWCGDNITVQQQPYQAIDWEAVRRQEAEQVRQEMERVAAEKAAADEKALELLQDLITDDEFAIYQKTGRLLVRGRSHDYLVQRDSGRVVRCEKGKVADLCMHLENYHAYSKHDNVVAMKLFLEGRENEFNREANLCGRRDPDQVERQLLKVVNG